MSRRSMIPVAVAVLTAACFLPTLSGSFFNWDDNVNFLDNPAYRGLGLAEARGLAAERAPGPSARP
jgi:hypothetical protein